MQTIIFRRLFSLMLIPVFFLLLSFTTTKTGDPKTANPLNDKDSTKGFLSLFSSLNGELNTAATFILNPSVIPFVKNYIDKESVDLNKMKSWADPYFDIYDKILIANGIPVELKYLSVIESSLKSKLRSSAGAVGPWQIMPDEARRFGLKMGSRTDERTNYRKSTAVAAQLLKELYGQFGDWLLVIAAYNAGTGAVNRAITKAGSKNFYVMQKYLPQETRNHVKKYIATHYFFEGSGGWTTLTAKETLEKENAISKIQDRINASLLANTRTTEITGRYSSLAIATHISMDIKQFNSLNPLFDETLAENDSYTLHLPADKMEEFKVNKQQIQEESRQLILPHYTSATQDASVSLTNK